MADQRRSLRHLGSGSLDVEVGRDNGAEPPGSLAQRAGRAESGRGGSAAT